MARGHTPEDVFIKIFLSGYERGSWADAGCKKPDAIDRMKPAVDQIATRKFDGKVLAIEHTIIEPFVKEKEDFASFEDLLAIEDDRTLAVQGLWIQIFVPVGTMRSRPAATRAATVQSVHEWIKMNRLSLVEGSAQHRCRIAGIPSEPHGEVTLTLKVTPLRRGSAAEPGVVHVRRQQVNSDLGDVIEKALNRKLPKLVMAPADKRILLLERQHMNCVPASILEEIESRRQRFPMLSCVDEIWIVETPFYGTVFGGTYLRFERYLNGKMIESLDFDDGKLLMRSEDGMAEMRNHYSHTEAGRHY